MKTVFAILASVIGFVSIAFGEVINIPNGDFETLGGTSPYRWTYSAPSGSPTIYEKSIVSPFTLSYPASKTSVKLATTGNALLYSDFAPSSGVLSFSFDFRLGSGTIASDDYWFCDFNGTNGTLNLLRIGENGNLKILDDSPALSIPLIRDAWYHLAFTFDTALATYDVSLIQFGQSTQTWNDRIPMNPHTAITRAYINRLKSTGTIASLYLDNFAITAIPEPSVLNLSLFALAVAAIRPALRRKAKPQTPSRL